MVMIPTKFAASCLWLQPSISMMSFPLSRCWRFAVPFCCGLSIMTHAFLSPRKQTTRRFSPSSISFSIPSFDANDTLLMAPPADRVSLDPSQHTAIVLLPGCLIKPIQYKAVAEAIQKHSKRAVWVVVPKLFLDMANPFTVPHAVRRSVNNLKDAGFRGKAFIGGHSLGGTFLPSIFENGIEESHVAGMIYLGCFLTRGNKAAKSDKDHLNPSHSVPCLTIAGDLDGLIRTSRIAEDYHRHVDVLGDTEEARLNHSVVLVEGMNHFGFIEGKAPFMEKFRDLTPEISHAEAVQGVATAISEFMDTHCLACAQQQKQALLSKIDRTSRYLRPMLDAMALEGSYHMATPCYLCDDDGACDLDCVKGSPWAARVQQDLVTDLKVSESIGEIRDEFRRSWWTNPFRDQHSFPFPRVVDNGSHKLDIHTFTEGVYEKADFFFDAGFFSNAAVELRSKFNSPQSVLDALGHEAPLDSNRRACSKMNEKTIEWALENAPLRVRQRYLQHGVKLRAGEDIEHSSGPGWIWSYLSFRKGLAEGEDEVIQFVDSHTLRTPIDHPLPLLSGKLYCKLLSPAKALDWMYTDSLRSRMR